MLWYNSCLWDAEESGKIGFQTAEGISRLKRASLLLQEVISIIQKGMKKGPGVGRAILFCADKRENPEPCLGPSQGFALEEKRQEPEVSGCRQVQAFGKRPIFERPSQTSVVFGIG